LHPPDNHCANGYLGGWAIIEDAEVVFLALCEPKLGWKSDVDEGESGWKQRRLAACEDGKDSGEGT
jgi:hypothetical protein